MTTETLPVPGSAPEAKVPVASPASAQPAVNPAPDQAKPGESAEGVSDPKSKVDESKPDDAAPKPKQTASERIGQLYAQKRNAEAERDAERANAARLQGELEKLHTLLRSEGLSYEDQQALQLRSMLKAEKFEDARAAVEAKSRAVEDLKASEYVAKLEEARHASRLPQDFDAAYQVVKHIPLHDAATDIIMESEFAADLTYHLGKYPTEAYKISRLPPHKQAAEIARLEAKFSAPQPRRHSNAPPPSPVISGGSTVTAKDPANMTMEEYTKWRSGKAA